MTKTVTGSSEKEIATSEENDFYEMVVTSYLYWVDGSKTVKRITASSTKQSSNNYYKSSSDLKGIVAYKSTRHGGNCMYACMHAVAFVDLNVFIVYLQLIRKVYACEG